MEKAQTALEKMSCKEKQRGQAAGGRWVMGQRDLRQGREVYSSANQVTQERMTKERASKVLVLEKKSFNG